MDKLRALAAKCGIKPELAESFFDAVDKHLTRKRAELLEEHRHRQEEAKRICLEEVESYRTDLARRLQIFCEAKGAQIEQVVAKRSAMKESAAQVKLRNILSLLEGVEPNGGNQGTLQAENVKLKRQMQKLVSENRKAVEAYNRQSALAAKVLGANRKLEADIRENKRTSGTVLTEGREGKRLDESRRRRPSGEPVTTRPTQRENQIRRPQPQVRKGDHTPDGIAMMMESELI